MAAIYMRGSYLNVLECILLYNLPVDCEQL